MKNNTKKFGQVGITSSSEGWFSRIWGTLEHAVNNIIGILLFVLILFSILYTFAYPIFLMKDLALKDFLITPTEIWKFIVPALLTIIGYLIGRSKS